MKLPLFFTTVTPFSKSLALLMFVGLPFVGFYTGMKYQQAITLETRPVVIPQAVKPTRTPTTTSVLPKDTPTPTKINPPELLIYRNEEIGIEFSYPKWMGLPQAERVINNNEGAAKFEKGKKFQISFSNLPNTIVIDAISRDYNTWLYTKPNRECPVSGAIDNSPDGFSRQCQTVRYGSTELVMANIFDVMECSSSLYTTWYIPNLGSNGYDSLDISIFYSGTEAQKAFDCTNDQKAKTSYDLAARFSQNIIDNKIPEDLQKQFEAIRIIIESIDKIKPQQ
jgi:hypothetical protein